MKYLIAQIRQTQSYAAYLRQCGDEFNIEKSVKEIMNSLQPYIMLQRTYGEDDFEEDFYYFETIDFDKSEELKDFTIEI